MKKLTHLRLINWYHILDQTLPIQGSALFMGDNGTGKSTLLDALQFALVADLNQVRFNQAANEQAARNLQSYTRWMLNTEGTKETHQYARGDCSSYVLLEFTEPWQGKDLRFVIGVVIDSFRDGREPSRLHFIANHCSLNEIPVFHGDGRTPLSSSEFRQKMANRTGFSYSRDPGPYREQLLIRLGHLSPDFMKILVKAQAFKPLGQVHQFVMDFLLDPRELETESLQANLSHYKALEQKAAEALKRIAHLEKITAKHGDFERIRDEILTFRFLELRSLAGMEEEKITVFKKNLESGRSEKTKTEADIEETKKNQTRCEEELGSVFRSLSQNSKYLERERIREDLRKEDADLAFARTHLQRALEKKKELGTLREEVQKINPDPSLFHCPVTELVYLARKNKDTATAELLNLRTAGTEAQKKLEDLKKGVRPSPKEARVLKELLEDELRHQAPMLCELLEITDEAWQAAVEGYLNTRRFDIVLPPALFSRALSLYESRKRQLQIHGVGLVNSEKLLQISPKAKPNSLAEIVTSQNASAKAYSDFLMGEVIRCESEQELKKHNRSTTATCMVYQNHAARQTPFHVFESWFIGSRGASKLVEQTEREIASVHVGFLKEVENEKNWNRIHALACKMEEAYTAVSKIPELEKEKSDLETRRLRLQEHLQSLNAEEFETLERRIEELRTERNRTVEDLQEKAKALGGIEERIAKTIAENETAEKELSRLFSDLALEFGHPDMTEKRPQLERRYQEEEKGKLNRSPQEIHRVYEQQKRGRETLRSNLMEQLATLRAEYNNAFGFSAPSQGEDCSAYLTELKTWQESFLPEYQQKIEKAKETAMQQLMEDVIHKLRENLDRIPYQFDQINRALRGFHFGLDQYQFIYKVRREFEAFEKLVREASQYEKQPLFETSWKDRFRHQKELEILFSNLVSGSHLQVQEELKQYSDYREYYDYDLRILHADGTSSLYSQVNRWKSGGETQAPYYIAILASLYRLYRLNRENGKKERSSIGLVILDEAFNKMDEDRLKATLDLTRKLGLQLLLATPKERAELISPHVESTFLVTKDPQTGHAFILDLHQDLTEQTKHLEPLEQTEVLVPHDPLSAPAPTKSDFAQSPQPA